MLFDVYLVYFEEQGDPLPTLHGAYSTETIANAVAEYLKKDHFSTEVIPRKAVELVVGPTKDESKNVDVEMFLIDTDPCPLRIDIDLKSMATRVIGDLTEEQRTIILSSKRFS